MKCLEGRRRTCQWHVLHYVLPFLHIKAFPMNSPKWGQFHKRREPALDCALLSSTLHKGHWGASSLHFSAFKLVRVRANCEPLSGWVFRTEGSTYQTWVLIRGLIVPFWILSELDHPVLSTPRAQNPAGLGREQRTTGILQHPAGSLALWWYRSVVNLFHRKKKALRKATEILATRNWFSASL